MAAVKKVLSHFIHHSEWPHVTVAYVQTVTVAGEPFSKPTEANLDSPAVMKAAKALEKAILAEIGGELPKAAVAAASVNGTGAAAEARTARKAGARPK